MKLWETKVLDIILRTNETYITKIIGIMFYF